jgi:class 3 adenylate cyclase
MELDVSDVLAAVRVPTLIFPRSTIPGPAYYAAERLRDATVVELPRFEGVYTWIVDAAHEATIDASARFISRLTAAATPQRVLATVLFTDLVGSTDATASLGDRAWRQLLERHHAIVRRELGRFSGRELDTAGDGFLAMFDGPARAVQAAAAMREELGVIGLTIRAGLHTGECEVSDGKLVGIALSIGARIAAIAGPGEVLVSRTVKDLVAGSGLTFVDRGEHRLKGVPDAWQVFALDGV